MEEVKDEGSENGNENGNENGKKKEKEEVKGVVIHLSRPRRAAAQFEIVGLTDLICCALPPVINRKEDEVARKARLLKGSMPDEADMIEGPAKTPEDQYKQSLYPLPVQDMEGLQELMDLSIPAQNRRFGFPSAGIQASCATFLQRFNPINPKYAKDTPAVFYGVTFMFDELIPIISKDGPYMRHDIARNSRGKRIDVYRGAFRKGWRMKVRIEFNPDVITLERLTNALDSAGHMVGTGAWRPECRGRFGRFAVNPKAVSKIQAPEESMEAVA